MHENANTLLPELAAWNNNAGIDIESWIRCIGRYDHAIGYTTIFWPNFTLHDDCVFISSYNDKIDNWENYNNWMKTYHGDKTQVEKIMNHEHIINIFKNSEFTPTIDIIEYFGNLLVDMWLCKLKKDYPDNNIIVDFFEDSKIEGLNRYIITVYHEGRKGDSH